MSSPPKAYDPMRVDVDLRAAFVLRQHVRECSLCRMHDEPVCPVGLAMVEDALGMAGLYDRLRSAEETVRMLRDGTITFTGTSAMTKAEKVAEECATLDLYVHRFVEFAKAGQVREMLAEGVSVQAQLEEVAKTVTGT